jgi:hypothetical protein
VANPPFSYRWEPTDALGDDVRFKNHGLAPKSAADFAFLLHGFHFLKDEGVMAIILPHGVLFRGGAEERIRTKLLKDGHIDTVIGLPANLFYSTGIPGLHSGAEEVQEAGRRAVHQRRRALRERQAAEPADPSTSPRSSDLPAPQGRAALLAPGGDGGDREERFQPEHLALHQHGGGRGSRFAGNQYRIGHPVEKHKGCTRQTQCLPQRVNN